MSAIVPYSFPARSRKAMRDYLSEHESYHPMSSWNGGFVLAWSVKVSMSFDTSGHKAMPNRFDRSLDDEWSKYSQAYETFQYACADGLRQYLDGEWTNYPGIEQGEWRFAQNGRSGGWLMLKDAPAWLPKPRGWRCHRMTWESHGDFLDWLDELSFAELRKFYRAIRVLDQDLSRAAIKQEMEYQYAFQRELWEDEKREEREAAACAMAQAIADDRPDLVPGFV